jgi:hypothetical protein
MEALLLVMPLALSNFEASVLNAVNNTVTIIYPSGPPSGPVPGKRFRFTGSPVRFPLHVPDKIIDLQAGLYL